MNKQEIADLLAGNHNRFLEQLRSLNDAAFLYAPEGKWNAAQQLDHIVKSVSPVNLAMGVPKFILQWKFGKANRPSKTYAELIDKYTLKLQGGGRASGRFVPSVIPVAQREDLYVQLTWLIKRLHKKIVAQNEEALDKYILPHPLLGKLTLREMLYFTAYHVEHHGILVNKGLQEYSAATV